MNYFGRHFTDYSRENAIPSSDVYYKLLTRTYLSEFGYILGTTLSDTSLASVVKSVSREETFTLNYKLGLICESLVTLYELLWASLHWLPR